MAIIGLLQSFCQGQMMQFSNHQGLTNQKNFHLPTGQVKKKITCPVEKLACPDLFFKNKKYPSLHIAFPKIWTSCIS